MWELDHKKYWVPKNWCSWTLVLKKTLERNLDCKIKPVNPKGNQPWIFIGRTDAEAEVPVLRPPDAKNWFIGKDPDARKDWRQEETGITKDDWVVSLTWWTCVWASSGSWWWTGKHGVLQSMESQKVGHDWITELTEDILFWAFLSVQLSGIKYIHTIVQPGFVPPSISRIFSSSQTRTLYPLNNNSSFLPDPGNHLSLWVWLLQGPQVCGNIQYLSFCDCLSTDF